MRAVTSKNEGFTLIELIVVILILGILAATALPKLIDLGSDARLSILKAANGSLSAANALIYAKSATAGGTASAAGAVTINGSTASITINTAYGYAKSMQDLLKATDLNAEQSGTSNNQFGNALTNGSPDFTFTTTGTGGTLYPTNANSSTACSITYAAPTGAGLTPQITGLPSGSTNPC